MTSYKSNKNATKSQFQTRSMPNTAQITAFLKYFSDLPNKPQTLADFQDHWAKVKYMPLSAGQMVLIIDRLAQTYTRHKDGAFTPEIYSTLQKQMYFWQIPFMRTRTDLNAFETQSAIESLHTLNVTLQDGTLNKLEMAFVQHLPTATMPNLYHASALFLKNRHAITQQSATALEQKLAAQPSLIPPLELQKIIAAITLGKGRMSEASVNLINKSLTAKGATLSPQAAARLLQDATRAKIKLTPDAKSFLEASLTEKTNTTLPLHTAIQALRAYNTSNGTPDMDVIKTLDDAIANGLIANTDPKDANYVLYAYNQSGFKPSKAVIHAAYKNIGAKINTIPLEIAARFMRNFSRLGIVPASPLLQTVADRFDAEYNSFKLDQNMVTEAIYACAVLDAIAADPSLKRIAKTLSQTQLMPTSPLAMRIRMRDACMWFGLSNPVLQHKITTGEHTSNTERRLSSMFAASGVEINSKNVYIHALGKQADFAIPRTNARGYVYIELDGPHHFMKSMDGINNYNGDTIFQTRLLEKTNPHDLIIRIPHDHLSAAEQGRTMYQTGKMLDNALKRTQYLGTHRSHVMLLRENKLTLSKI